MAEKMKKGVALRTFSDAGTGQTFEGEKAHEFSEGAYANYLAAGLIAEPGSDEAKAKTGDATKVGDPTTKPAT